MNSVLKSALLNLAIVPTGGGAPIAIGQVAGNLIGTIVGMVQKRPTRPDGSTLTVEEVLASIEKGFAPFEQIKHSAEAELHKGE